MYRKKQFNKETFMVNNQKPGMTIEQKMREIKNNKEKVEAISPLAFTKRRDGIIPEYDIRTDKFEMAAAAADKMATSHINKRTEDWKQSDEAKKNMEIEKKSEGKDGQAESTQTTE